MMHSWSFQRKVAAGFVVMVGLGAITAGIAVYALRTVVAAKDAVISVESQALIESARLMAISNRQAAGFRGFLASPEQRFLDERSAAIHEFDECMHRIKGLVLTDEGLRLMAEVEREQGALISLQERGIALRTGKGGGMTAAVDLLKAQILPHRDRLAAGVDAFVQLKQHLLERARQESTAQAAMASTLLIALACVSVLFAGAAALLLGRTLSRQIGTAVQHVQSSSAELQTSANQQATGAREASTAMNEITTTMSELLATSRQIADSAQQVARIAGETAKAAQGGEQTVAQSQASVDDIRAQVEIIVGHMLDLGKKSQQIGGILEIINELAEQTNILSINATIEAAGAGEHGKRFAVVGEEIRKLAERVAGSGKEIRALVEEVRAAVNTTVLATEGGSKAVDTGLHRFAEVTRGFKQIASMVATTTQAAREIELSTKQQMTAVEQVNAAMGGAAQATRQTETSSVQTLDTASQLAKLSRNLSQLVQSSAHA